MKKLPGIFLASPREMVTTPNASNPSVRAPLWMSTFKRGPRPISGKVSIRSRTAVIDPITYRKINQKTLYSKVVVFKSETLFTKTRWVNDRVNETLKDGKDNCSSKTI